MKDKIKLLKQEVGKVIVGQEEMIEGLLLALMCNGHILLEGVPGLAKTTAINAFASAIGVDSKRVQFTPDLLPSDILGSEVYDISKNEFKLKHGPIFTNLLLADEINRAPAKVQSALLEVMQERQVTIGETSFKLDEPFLVLATQNPVEQEGTYSLPEAQLDRFMLKIVVGYNTKEEELEVVKRVTSKTREVVNNVLNVDDIMKLRDEVRDIHVDEEVKKYMIDLVFASRNPNENNLSHIAKYIQFGVSPRGSIDLYKVATAKAYFNGKDYVTPLDIAKVFKLVLRHRLILSYEALAENIKVDYILDEILKVVKIP